MTWALDKNRPPHKIQIPLYQDNADSPSKKTGCPICDGKCDPIKHGSYWRNAIESNGDKELLRIQRFLCKSRGGTFSFLPERLIPYRTPSLPLLENLWQEMLDTPKSHQEMIADIINCYPNSSMADWEYSRLADLLHIFQVAMDQITILENQRFASLSDFFSYCQQYTLHGQRGFLAIAKAFHAQHHRFLFGTASQHR